MLAALLCAWLAIALTGSAAAAAIAGTWGDTIGFHGVMLGRELSCRRQRALPTILRDLVIVRRSPCCLRQSCGVINLADTRDQTPQAWRLMMNKVLQALIDTIRLAAGATELGGAAYSPTTEHMRRPSTKPAPERAGAARQREEEQNLVPTHSRQ